MRSGWINQADNRSRRATGLLSRLVGDVRGNTLAIVGAAMIPLTAMIGSGVDMSRAYMAKHRLQSACDAAALAGRRVMKNDTLDQGVTDEATKFFNFNFRQRLYQTDAFTPTITKPMTGTVRVTAKTKIPTAIMSVFGWKKLNLAVTCDASLNFVNTDIVLVLDTTGSMLCATSETSCSNSSEKTSSKIKALREAVLALYDQLKPIQDQLQAQGLRLRFGLVPYSSSVNVGKLIYATNPNYLVDSWDYQSRVPYFTIDNVTKASCSGLENWSWKASSWRSSTGKCTYTSDTGGEGGSWTGGFDYDQMTHDVSVYKRGLATPVPSRQPGSSTKATWAGCIEERQTSNSITSSSGFAIPSDANDLDLNLVPSANDSTKWAPFWPEVEYLPSNSYQYKGESNKPQWACPAGAKRLQAWDRTSLSNYLDTLNADGGTYHDNGMIWGGRLISPGGVFGDSPNSYGGMPTARYVIFMTDGLLDTGYSTLYTTYGVENIDHRVGASSENDQTARHRQRFRMMCNAVKGQNVSIWVIAFASSLDSTLTECASNSAQASVSSNRDDLIDRFTEIGRNIGALRLTQ